MGTNYYALLPQCTHPCEHCAFDDELHIGKSSGGWKFGFQGHPDRGLTSWAAWQAFIRDQDLNLKDEYDQIVTLDELTEVVTKRWVPTSLSRPICRVEPTPIEIARGFGGHFYEDHGDYHDPDGFDFYDGDFS